MFKYLILFALAACKSAPAPQPSPVERTCTTAYDPHLCLITIDSTTFSGHGSNKCIALEKLRVALVKRGHNPLILQKAECGRVFN